MRATLFLFLGLFACVLRDLPDCQAQQKAAGTATAIKAVPLKVLPRALPAALNKNARANSAAVNRPPTTGTITSSAAGTTAIPVPAAATTQQHVLKINRLKFDRRPSAILAAWAATGRPASSEVPPEPAHSTERPPGPSLPATPASPAASVDPFDEQLLEFQQQVTLGKWTEVKAFLASLPADEAKALYRKLLSSLQMAPPRAARTVPAVPRPPGTAVASLPANARQYAEKHVCSCDDLLALAACAPIALDDTLIELLGGLLRHSLATGNSMSTFLERFRLETAKQDPVATLNRKQVARVLFAANRGLDAGEFLPSLEESETSNDLAALNLLSQFHLAQYTNDKTTSQLELAWRATQAVLAKAGQSTQYREEMEKALRRAVDVAPQVRDELGQQWLNKSFTGNPSRGMDILASIGSSSAQALQRSWKDANTRVKGLELQTTAVEALLASAPELADRWQHSLTLLAQNWLREAEISYQFDESTSRKGQLQRDQFGNFFYRNQKQRTTSRIASIPTGDLLELRPGTHWLSLVDEGLRAKFAMLSAQLLLKINEEDQAFPYIERLTESHPKLGKELVDEFLRVWTNNHDPNANRNNTGRYMFMYGFERKAESIPLTRSKQERNLQELSRLVARLKTLPVKLNEGLLATAFTRCHSSAEVYRLTAIEKVFGKLGDLEPGTLAELAQQMRANLIGVWRQPAVQKAKKTRRTQQDIEAEVLRGYEVARTVVENALQQHPKSWALYLARASLDHDENTYLKELKPDSNFTQRRGNAFSGFSEAARLYAATLPGLSPEEETSKVYEIWFYASLGACDLNQITERQTADLSQVKKIKEAITSLDSEASKRHLALFANTLFTRMSAAKPAIKFRYVRNGLEIVGQHKQASEARKIYDYYNDLVTEIKLEAKIDGSDIVGHSEPFGVFVELRHTREIERESGGFGRYLQNQQNGNSFYYNYGRPLANYRDKFEEGVRQALEEHFEVLSVTFQHEDVNSRARADEYGWRVTPYAYLLLQARGPEADTLPGLQLNLDFLDTSGYVIIPIASTAVPLDASPKQGKPRPLEQLSITQTLDERQADEGKLILELKAVGKGLVPQFEDLVDLDPEGFMVTNLQDQGLSVSEFDSESRGSSLIVSERTWMITLAATTDAENRPQAFSFAQAKTDDAKVVYQRFADADLVSVEKTVALEQNYGQSGYRWYFGATIIGASLLVIAGSLVMFMKKRDVHSAEPSIAMPSEVNAFTVLGLLKQIREKHTADSAPGRELANAIANLEVEFFSKQGSSPSDLEALARSWIQRTA
ncbi:MAG TPA: hypothetical protein DCE55_03240 [Planctomycetaceae bacterium]|nr:hypothetical protein [Planctomycetaceae bacterium]|tara:strand:+ start:10444 stop:14313 length:3870 start_codon:yes stop_codon:yes gene_type:complete